MRLAGPSSGYHWHGLYRVHVLKPHLLQARFSAVLAYLDLSRTSHVVELAAVLLRFNVSQPQHFRSPRRYWPPPDLLFADGPLRPVQQFAQKVYWYPVCVTIELDRVRPSVRFVFHGPKKSRWFRSDG